MLLCSNVHLAISKMLIFLLRASTLLELTDERKRESSERSEL